MLHKKNTSVAILALLLALAATPKPLAAFLEIEPVQAQSPTASPNTELSPASGSNADATTSVESKGGIPLWFWLLPIAILGLLLWWWLQNRQTQSDRTEDSDRSTSGREEQSSPDRINDYRNRIDPHPTPEVTPSPDVSDQAETSQTVGTDLATSTDSDISSEQSYISSDRDEQASSTDRSPFPSDPTPVVAPTPTTSEQIEDATPTSANLTEEITSASPVVVQETTPTLPELTEETAQPASNLTEEEFPATPHPIEEVATAEEAPSTGTEAVVEPLVAQEQEQPESESTIVLTPRSFQEAYVQWDVSEQDKATLRQQGGTRLALRICDVTGIDPNTQQTGGCQHYECDEQERDRYVTIAVRDRDYMAEIGYTTAEGGWLLLARSAPERIPPAKRIEDLIPESGTALSEQAAPSTGTGAVAEPLVAQEQEQPESESTIVLTPRNFQEAYVHWDVSEQDKATLRQQGGTRLALRICDVTGIDPNTQQTHGCQHYECDEQERDRYVTIAVRDRDYMAEIGYTTGEGGWLLLARSAPVRIPPVSVEAALPAQ